MKRGEFYRIYKGSPNDPKRYRVFIIVSRQVVIDSKYSTVICAPVYTHYNGLATQVPVGIEEGLKHESAVYCDELISIRKSALNHFIGTISDTKRKVLNLALTVALGIE